MLLVHLFDSFYLSHFAQWFASFRLLSRACWFFPRNDLIDALVDDVPLAFFRVRVRPTHRHRLFSLIFELFRLVLDASPRGALRGALHGALRDGELDPNDDVPHHPPNGHHFKYLSSQWLVRFFAHLKSVTASIVHHL